MLKILHTPSSLKAYVHLYGNADGDALDVDEPGLWMVCQLQDLYVTTGSISPGYHCSKPMTERRCMLD